jgi:hypothetical protein
VRSSRLEGIIVGGFSTTLDASPVMNLVAPVNGSMTVATISCVIRRLPVVVVFRTSHAVRCSTSPSSMPPSVVLIRSFSDARLFSK